jgi:hypothetical protein
MSRTVSIIMIIVVAVLVVGVLGAAVVMLGRGFFTIAGSNTQYTTPIVVVEITPVVTDNPASPTPAPGATAIVETAVPPAPIVTPEPPATPTSPVTAVSVLNTPVQYVMAVGDVNMRSGPGTGYGVIGWVAAGQIAKVTGLSGDNGWWRVVCPDDTVGSCWVTALAQYTQPTTAPAVSTPIPTVCTNAAEFVADVTVPDGSEIQVGAQFLKTWRIRNSGTCTWDGRYHFVHAGGPVLGAVVEQMPLPAAVVPGQTIDLSMQMMAPVTPGFYQSDWKLASPQGMFFGVGRNSAPLWVKVNVISGPSQHSNISGLIYQDWNQNGVYDSGETLMGSREVRLIPGTACHVAGQAVATVYSDGNGRYQFSGPFSGSFCVGLVGDGGLDDVVSVSLTTGQIINNINLKSPVPSGSISGFLWSDYCLTNENGDPLDGNCVADGNGHYHADGMIQPTESYIAGVTILLQAGRCGTDNPVAVAAVTDSTGKYVFNSLQPGTYCVSMNAAAGANMGILLPGDWTFPARGIWYHEITIQQGENAFPVNFGWDYQLK